MTSRHQAKRGSVRSNRREPVVGETNGARDRAASGPKGLRADNERWLAELLKGEAVEHTARGAAPSIADGGEAWLARRQYWSNGHRYSALGSGQRLLFRHL